MILFTTKNLKIETIQLDKDSNALLKIHNCKDTMKWIPSNTNSWNTDTLKQKYIKNDFLYPQNLGIYKISLINELPTQIIGEVLLLQYSEQEGQLEIGYILHKEYWQKGYGTELLTGIEVYMSQSDMKIDLIAQLFESNIASRKLLEKMKYILINKKELGTNSYKLIYQKKL